MKIVLLGRDRWSVFAVCSDEVTCPVLDFVQDELEAKRGRKVLSDLREYVPFSDPKDWVRTDFSKSLTDSDAIYEFRWPKSKGGTPRVLWFYDKQHVVVCSHGINKKGELSPEEIRAAEGIKADYDTARADGDIEEVTYAEFTSPRKGADK
jgi:hypothetical protein